MEMLCRREISVEDISESEQAGPISLQRGEAALQIRP
jgi:hypothetical protein